MGSIQQESGETSVKSDPLAHGFHFHLEEWEDSSLDSIEMISISLIEAFIIRER